ncbi:CPBP family intramembrane metalloprotease [Niabella sp. CC-SYL272]|uniref:CPBP family intramembrane glutamic endopeptidase n=1 Tax=Niabella agricola TaxID=2891571 RepID=UPI001F314A3E|nr:type II CAAX endopeptidase family protein [Niabella agricola]MCF3111221.1 CPBP family intramembrane metalloprotease [Niabella agricola]
MLGIIVELALSWILLWLLQKQSLTVLGIFPKKRRMRALLLGLIVAGIVNAIYHIATAGVVKDPWQWNVAFTPRDFVSSFWWVLKSVLFEELLFRGALLYLLIKYIGASKACWVAAIAFGIYHWFSYGVFGNPVQMVIIFLITGLAGLMYACAFSRTGSLYLPVGLHLGWNLVNIIVFSNGPLGRQWLFRNGDLKPAGLPSLFLFLFQVLVLPLLVLGYLRVFKKRKPSAV